MKNNSKDDWFENPLDSMPIATNDNKYHPDPNYSPIPRPEEEVADWFSDKKVEKTDKKDDVIVEEDTIHEKLYKMATAKYNPFAVGGSESIHDFDGGSENVQKL